MNSIFAYVGSILICMSLTVAAEAGTNMDPGPLQTTNRLPLHLMFLTPRPAKAQVPDYREFEASLAVEYSSVNLDYAGRRWDVLMDMEMMIIDLSLSYGVGSKMALKLDVPLVSMGDGFLDGFLGNYHDALGVSNYGREDRPDNKFGYHASKDGDVWFEGETGTLGLADVTLSTQIEISTAAADHRKRTTALLLSIKLPTGDENIGMGSGAYDAGLYIPVQWTGMPWSFYLMPGVAIISDPESRQAEVSARDSISLFAGAAYDYSVHMRLLAQLNYHTSPFEDTESSWLDNGALELSLGFQRKLRNRLLLEFAFSEDLTQAAPDFNLRLGLVWTAKEGGKSSTRATNAEQ